MHRATTAYLQLRCISFHHRALCHYLQLRVAGRVEQLSSRQCSISKFTLIHRANVYRSHPRLSGRCTRDARAVIRMQPSRGEERGHRRNSALMERTTTSSRIAGYRTCHSALPSSSSTLLRLRRLLLPIQPLSPPRAAAFLLHEVVELGEVETERMLLTPLHHGVEEVTARLTVHRHRTVPSRLELHTSRNE